jgi:hypothetical protein
VICGSWVPPPFLEVNAIISHPFPNPYTTTCAKQNKVLTLALFLFLPFAKPWVTNSSGINPSYSIDAALVVGYAALERRNHMKSRLLVLTLLTLILTGCLGSSPGTGTAEVGIFVTETALNSALNLSAQNTESVEEIWVTVSKVTARVDGRWVTLLQVPEGDGRINLKDLRFRERLLGTSHIPAGKYTEIRFELKENQAGGTLHNYIVLADGSTIALKVPSSELKPDLNLSIAKDTVVELVFDVDLNFFVERGSDGSYIVNPRKALRFMESFREKFASLSGEIELPEGLGKLLSIEINLFRAGYPEPIWTTELKDGKLSFEIASLPAGEHHLEASLQLLGTASLTLTSGPFDLEAGTGKTITLRNTAK